MATDEHTGGTSRVGPYEILSRIETGRLAGIYRARHPDLDFPICLTLLRPHGTPGEVQSQLTRFQREARVSIQADHPNLVRTFQIGHVDDLYFMAFESLQGQSLGEVLASEDVLESGPVSEYITRLVDPVTGKHRPAEVCRIFSEAAVGLQCLHEREILHRDVTPDNIWLTPESHVKLMDFGLARDALSYLDSQMADRVVAGTSEFLGSTDYLSAEQALDAEAATPASDIYSLGCSLFHALTGEVPFQAASPAKQMILHAGTPPRAPSELNELVPRELDEIVGQMMAKHPEDRYESCTAVIRALSEFVDDDLTPPPRQQPRQLNDFLNWLDDHRSWLSGTE